MAGHQWPCVRCNTSWPVVLKSVSACRVQLHDDEFWKPTQSYDITEHDIAHMRWKLYHVTSAEDTSRTLLLRLISTASAISARKRRTSVRQRTDFENGRWRGVCGSNGCTTSRCRGNKSRTQTNCGRWCKTTWRSPYGPFVLLYFNMEAMTGVCTANRDMLAASVGMHRYITILQPKLLILITKVRHKGSRHNITIFVVLNRRWEGRRTRVVGLERACGKWTP